MMVEAGTDKTSTVRLLGEVADPSGVDGRLFEVIDQTRLAGLDAMGAALSHELNQPLTALMIYLQSMLKQSRALDPAAKTMLPDIAEKAVREAERAVDIVRRMRRLSIRMEPERSALNINSLVDETIRTAIVDGHRISFIRRHFAPALPPVMADAVQIRQIIVNLLRNASEACAGVKAPEITVSTAEARGSVLFSVGDNGPGVDPKIADRLFRAFETSKPDGQGIGLAISRMIAQNHGGDLFLDTKTPRGGAVFCLRLPTN
jgi:two-component system, LuxR family, sensor kinase FixL